MPGILVTWEAEIIGSPFCAQSRQIVLETQNNQGKNDWRYGSRIEHLLRKHKVLSSNPHLTNINQSINK
jgi:hypothetical protein